MNFYTNMGNINFTARLMDEATVQQRGSWLKYRDTDVSIVELDSANKQDLDALNKASTSWCKKGAKYADSIFFEAKYEEKTSERINHIYAVTTQKQNFEELVPNKILGLMLFHEKKDPHNEIALLEVNPSTNKSFNFIRKYKQVGRKLVEFVQTKFPQKNIDVWSAYDARKFYKKLGFVQNPRKVCDMCWKSVK